MGRFCKVRKWGYKGSLLACPDHQDCYFNVPFGFLVVFLIWYSLLLSGNSEYSHGCDHESKTERKEWYLYLDHSHKWQKIPFFAHLLGRKFVLSPSFIPLFLVWVHFCLLLLPINSKKSQHESQVNQTNFFCTYPYLKLLELAKMATAPALKRSESIADSMPEALRQSRYHMKKCFAKYIEQGKRMMKLHNLMDELEKVIDDPAERNHVLEGLLGYILCTTMV